MSRELNIEVLVNRQNLLSPEDGPRQIVVVDQNENNFHNYADPTLKPILDKRVYEDYIRLHESAKKDGFVLVVDSAYRSFAYQAKILENNIKAKGEDYAYSFVAPPGASEHQTGLAIDFACYHNGVFDENLTDEEKKWLKENAYKFGFILRYPEKKEQITGYSYEPWHYRYVGKLAILLHQFDITLEEYYLNKDYYDSFSLTKENSKTL